MRAGGVCPCHRHGRGLGNVWESQQWQGSDQGGYEWRAGEVTIEEAGVSAVKRKQDCRLSERSGMNGRRDEPDARLRRRWRWAELESKMGFTA